MKEKLISRNGKFHVKWVNVSWGVPDDSAERKIAKVLEKNTFSTRKVMF